VLACCEFAAPGNAQQAAPLTKHGAAVKKTVEQLPPRAKITVVREQAENVYGSVVSAGEESFRLYDVDRNAEVTLPYDGVKKIKRGYGGYNSIQGRHTSRRTRTIVVLAVAAALGGLIAAVVVAKD
jgi:hypothetical protein